MEGHTSRSVVQTPLNSVHVQRRSHSVGYRRSCIGGLSRICTTPAARRFSTYRRVSKSRNITERVGQEQLDLLVKSEWHLSYVTPLYQFRHTQLRTYSQQLSAFIAAEKQQGLAVEVEGLHGTFRVSFSVLRGMVETDTDAETVLVQVHSKPVFAGQDEPQKVIWSCWLTCINGNAAYIRSLPKDFTCLPLFCSRGPVHLTSIVQSWFQRTFDCCFGPLEINQTSLQWFAALWTNCHLESAIQQLKMIWTIPVTPPLTVAYAMKGNDAWELWSSVRKEQEEGGDAEGSSIDIEEVTKFMEALKGHFYRHFMLDLSAGRLDHVSTALGSAKSSGKIKITDTKYLISTLALLTECALLKMPI